jgi:hypothetical protein
MKYICLVFNDRERFEPLSPDGLDALDDASIAHDEGLRQSGHLVLAEALQSGKTATTIRVRDGRMSATDGPFAETTEQLGGVLCLEARDLEEAKSIAAGFPVAAYTTIEIRPVRDETEGARRRQAR